MLMWINQNFLLLDDLTVDGDLHFTFFSLRGSGPLNLEMSQNGQVSKEDTLFDIHYV